MSLEPNQQNGGEDINLSMSREELIARLADDGRLYNPDRQSGFERISRERFEALALWGLPQDFRDECSPASFWSADRERLLAAVYLKGGPSPRVLFSRTVTLDLLGREINDDYQPALDAEDAAEKASRR